MVVRPDRKSRLYNPTALVSVNRHTHVGLETYVQGEAVPRINETSGEGLVESREVGRLLQADAKRKTGFQKDTVAFFRTRVTRKQRFERPNGDPAAPAHTPPELEPEMLAKDSHRQPTREASYGETRGYCEWRTALINIVDCRRGRRPFPHPKPLIACRV